MPDDQGPTQQPIRLAALVSGGGTTVQNLADQIAAGQLHAQISLVIASNDKAYDTVTDFS